MMVILKVCFTQQLCRVFGPRSRKNILGLHNKALVTLLPFPTSYLREAGFSTMATCKTKARNRLNISSTMRVALSTIIPRWHQLVEIMQAQGSH